MNSTGSSETHFKQHPDVAMANETEDIRVKIETMLQKDSSPDGIEHALTEVEEVIPYLKSIGNDQAVKYFQNWAIELQAKLGEKIPA